MRPISLALLLAFGSCTRPLYPPPPDGGGACATHSDRDSCTADPSCSLASCPSCNGAFLFGACYERGGTPPVFHCLATACALPCNGLDEAACDAAPGCVADHCCGGFAGCRSDNDVQHVCPLSCPALCPGRPEQSCNSFAGCRPDYCPSCTPGQNTYVGCSDLGASPVGCAPEPCPSGSCESVGSADACSGRPDCHSVYQPAACECANCCCMAFHSCASGKADCKGPAACASPSPLCNEGTCGGQFTTGYTGICYEGCVHVADCAP
jgi:hypothetical protein